MVALMRLSSSSSPLMANCKCLGDIRFTLRSLHAFPANSNTLRKLNGIEKSKMNTSQYYFSSQIF